MGWKSGFCSAIWRNWRLLRLIVPTVRMPMLTRWAVESPSVRREGMSLGSVGNGGGWPWGEPVGWVAVTDAEAAADAPGAVCAPAGAIPGGGACFPSAIAFA